MGIAVIGGLLTRLFLTLVVVPAAYDLFDDMQGFFKKLGEKKQVANSRPQASSGPHRGSGRGGCEPGEVVNHEDVPDYLLRGGG
jgi:hypothetical protein